MSRLNTIVPEQATGQTAELFSGIKKSLGGVPNLFRALGNSPAALAAYLNLDAQLAKGVLTGQQREILALAVAAENACGYCASAHTVLGKMKGLSLEETVAIRKGTIEAADKRALAAFAREVLRTKGHVADETLEELRKHGFEDAHIAEATFVIAVNVFTNYFNHVNRTEIDFPRAEGV